VAASVICFYWNNHAVAWHGAAFEEFFDLRPNNLLYDHMIRSAFHQGYQWFDCNPAGGLAGVIAFKDNLGALRMQSRIVDQSSLVKKTGLFIRKILK
jgi:lipid II:glycine glycyltransferase (peptidoglycan interpeptide bridge formation enzyme)